MTQYTLFETEIGWAALAWTDAGLIGARLPETDREHARNRLLKRFPQAMEAEPTPEIARVTEGVRALMRGEPDDLGYARIDTTRAPDFDLKVYEIARTIPPGRTLTYGQIAEQIGDKRLAREVGAALGRNPWPIVVPCHRITAAGGKLGGFSAPGGAATKAKLLRIEGAAVVAPPAAPAPAQPSLFG